VEFTLDEIKDLLDAFEERNMQKMQLKKGEFELLLERTNPKGEFVTSTPLISAPSHAHHHMLPPHFPGHEKAGDLKTEVETASRFISSPMVGTFYSASSPGEAAFVAVGDTVKAGDVVCIVEAMKVMNEVKSTESGVVKEILVEDGHPVEYGTKIFKLG
jgi:acetyl-CoA carboxylase biotin carboxyl carrier protein